MRYVIDLVGEEAALGPGYESAAAKRAAEDASTGDTSEIVDFLDLRESYDLLNTHRKLLPEELSREVRQLTANLDRLVGIRNRVMHARPLAAGDSDAALSLLNQYQTQFWAELKRMIGQLRADPSWEPLETPTADGGFAIHNLPLPDYDETGLVGRSKDIANLVSLVKRRREPVITITGEGGIGKTALAIEVAYRIVDDAERPFDAVLWTSLKYEKLTAAGVREISGAARDITSATQPLGKVFDSDFDGSIKDLAEALEGFEVLVIIDNLETVGGAEFATLYNTLPETVTYLITSRIGVGEFERRYPLQPLSETDGLKLFNDFVRVRNIPGLSAISGEARRNVVQSLRSSPLGIKWFALAVEAGNDPVQLLRNQFDLLEFCVRSVYDALDTSARELLRALAILARPVRIDELLLFLDRSIDQISVSIQELMRGSLIRRETAPATDKDPTLRITLTETAVLFLNRRVDPDHELEREVTRRESEFLTIEERRASDIAKRSLDPVVVRSRSDDDAPTSQILRKALVASKSGDFESAFTHVAVARNLNPEFWEVDRVEGYLRSRAGDVSQATFCYQRAYKNAVGPDRAYVAHFFAGHLARRVKDIKQAIEFAEEAHLVLGKHETAVALGNYLVWSNRFQAGIDLIAPASAELQGKARLIAINSLAEAYRRWAEYSRSEDKNPLKQAALAHNGTRIILAALSSGVSDDKLRDTGAECAIEGIRGTVECLRNGTVVPKLPEWLIGLAAALVRFSRSTYWKPLLQEIFKLEKLATAPAAARKLADTARSLDSDSQAHFSESKENRGSLIGEVVSVRDNYGFLRHPAYPDNVFFHSSDVIDGDGFESFSTGILARFTVHITTRGPRAVEVTKV